MRDVTKILLGCYYPECKADHESGKKFCGSDHKHLSPARKDEVCHCGDPMRDHHGMSHNHAPVAMGERCPHSVGRLNNGEPEPCGEPTTPGEWPLCEEHTKQAEAITRKTVFPDHAVMPRKDGEFTHVPGSEDLPYDDEPEDDDDDDWMDDTVAQESWVAERMRNL